MLRQYVPGRRSFCKRSPLSFVIPTYRLGEVGQTVGRYDDHF